MSNKLKRKSKRMEPVGFTKEELKSVATVTKAKHNRAKFREDAYQNLKLIAYQILHDKYGFGRKRVSVVNDKVNGYIIAADEEQALFKGMRVLLLEKWKIDTAEEANMVPFRERFAISRYKCKEDSMQLGGSILLNSICDYFTLLGTCLKTQFHFSARQIKEVYAYIRDYINTLSRYKQFELKIEHIAESVAIECGYKDKRFIGENNGK